MGADDRCAYRQECDAGIACLGRIFTGRPIPAKLGILIVDRYDLPVAAKNTLWVFGHLPRDRNPPIAASDYGLSAYQLPGDQTKDFFFHEEGGKLTDFIMCNKGSEAAGVYSPQFSHYASLPNGLQFDLEHPLISLH